MAYPYFGHRHPFMLRARGTVLVAALMVAQQALAQPTKTDGWITSPGVLGTLALIGVVMFIAMLIISAKVDRILKTTKERKQRALRIPDDELRALDPATLTPEQQQRLDALRFKLKGHELGGTEPAFDDKALITRSTSEPDNPLVDEKIYSGTRLAVPPELTKLVLWYLGAATFWLVFGTLVGQYLGMKFVWPDLDEVSWLSFGRLRPVHTNTVFWGWASLAMIGLGYFVIARTSNTVIHSYRQGWWAWGLINASVNEVESGSTLVRGAGTTMVEIVSSVKRVTDIIGEISAATGEQSTQIGQVNSAVGQLDEMTQQNAALVEQSAAAAESLKEQAGRLSESVAVFRLDEHSVAGSLPSADDAQARVSAGVHRASEPHASSRMSAPQPATPASRRPADRTPKIATSSSPAVARPALPALSVTKTPSRPAPAPEPTAAAKAAAASASPSPRMPANEDDWETF